MESMDKIKRMERFLNAPSVPGQITPIDIEHAKSYPIENLIHDINRAGFERCVFHEERTSSMKIYRKTNTWHCFGACSEGGDTIDLVQKIHDITFIEAVKKLI